MKNIDKRNKKAISVDRRDLWDKYEWGYKTHLSNYKKEIKKIEAKNMEKNKTSFEKRRVKK